MIEEGSRAPELDIPDQNGNIVRLSDFKNETIILYFYPKDSTPGCTIEGIEFTKLKEKFNEYGAVIFGISNDDQQSHRRFIDECSLGITLLSDADKRVASDYGVYKEKMMYGRKYMGIERTTFIIKDGNIIKIYPKVNPSGHANEVLEFVKTV